MHFLSTLCRMRTKLFRTFFRLLSASAFLVIWQSFFPSEKKTSASFPSGHVMSPTYLYGFLLYLSVRSALPMTLRLPVGVWSACVLIFAGPPNVWLGVHWPSDVIGGWAWGLVLLGPLAYVHHVVRGRRRT